MKREQTSSISFLCLRACATFLSREILDGARQRRHRRSRKHSMPPSTADTGRRIDDLKHHLLGRGDPACCLRMTNSLHLQCSGSLSNVTPLATRVVQFLQAVFVLCHHVQRSPFSSVALCISTHRLVTWCSRRLLIDILRLLIYAVSATVDSGVSNSVVSLAYSIMPFVDRLFISTSCSLGSNTSYADTHGKVDNKRYAQAVRTVSPVLFGNGDVSGIAIDKPGLYSRVEGANNRVFEHAKLSQIHVVLTWFDGTQAENLVVEGSGYARTARSATEDLSAILFGYASCYIGPHHIPPLSARQQPATLSEGLVSPLRHPTVRAPRAPGC
ncbi:hypothetical protein BKA93DRAFT_932417 [Sparassis latifolia]